MCFLVSKITIQIQLLLKLNSVFSPTRNLDPDSNTTLVKVKCIANAISLFYWRIQIQLLLKLNVGKIIERRNKNDIQIQLLLKLNKFHYKSLLVFYLYSNTTLVKVKYQTLAEAEKIMLFKYNSC